MDDRPGQEELSLKSIYNRALLNRKVLLPITSIGKNIKEVLQEDIGFMFEGKCVKEGYIKKGSTKIITYSSGDMRRGGQVNFEIMFECYLCYPVEGMILSCIAKEITKAGIQAVSATEDPSPIIVFIARDHNVDFETFSKVKEGDKVMVRVIGQRFELNDTYISILGELWKKY